MPLSNEEIKQIVKENRNQKEIALGVEHQQRLRFHIETILNKTDLSDYYLDFKSWLGATGPNEPELLAKDKYDRLISLIRAPIQTIELTESIFSRLFRIFYAQDSYFNYRFIDDSLEADWAEYRDDLFWRVKGFEAMQTAIDSVWIAALPAEQMTEFPEPCNKLIDIENVLSIQNDQYNNCLHVVFKLGERVYVYDDASFRVWENDELKGDPIEVAHDLGYTPARMFWSERLVSQNNINKESPITKELTDLDWLLWHQTSKRYLDLANAYPTIISYDNDDDVQDDDITANEQRKTGKKPKGNHMMGPGSYFTVPAPRGSDEVDMMKNPMQVINPDVDTLQWHVNEETRLTDKIFKSVVGTDQEVRNDTAKNEMQIEGSYESQTSVLLRVKQNFEIINRFADSTLARLRYGERFLTCEIDYGTNFFLKDVDDLQTELREAKDSGASEVIVASIGENILNTRYRDDKRSRERADIISDLDPLPGKTMTESIEIFTNGGINKINFIIKSNLISFVKRFERENTDIFNFGSLVNYNRKIEQINAELVKYAEEMNDTNVELNTE